MRIDEWSLSKPHAIRCQQLKWHFVYRMIFRYIFGRSFLRHTQRDHKYSTCKHRKGGFMLLQRPSKREHLILVWKKDRLSFINRKNQRCHIKTEITINFATISHSQLIVRFFCPHYRSSFSNPWYHNRSITATFMRWMCSEHESKFRFVLFIVLRSCRSISLCFYFVFFLFFFSQIYISSCMLQVLICKHHIIVHGCCSNFFDCSPFDSYYVRSRDCDRPCKMTQYWFIHITCTLRVVCCQVMACHTMCII